MENISRQLMDISSSNEVDDFQFRRNVMNAIPAFRPGQFPTWVYLLPDLDTIIEEEKEEDKEEEEKEDREEEDEEDTEEEEQEDNPPDTDEMSVFRRNVMNAVPAFRQDRFPTWVSKLPDLDTIIEEEEEEDTEEEKQEDTEEEEQEDKEEEQEDREEEDQEDNPPDTDEMSVFRRNVINAVPAFRQDRFPTWVSKLPDLDTIIEEEEEEDREEEEEEDTEEEDQEDNPPDKDEMSVFRHNVINAVPAFRQDRFPTWVSSLPDLDTIIEEEEPDEDAAEVIPGLYYLIESEPPTLDTVIEDREEEDEEEELEEDEEDREEEEEEDKEEEDEEDKEEEDEEDREEEEEEDREEEDEEDKEEEDEEDREEEEKEGKPPDTEDMIVSDTYKVKVTIISKRAMMDMLFEEKQQEEQDGAIIPNLMDSATLDTLFANISDCTKLDTLYKNILEWTPDTVLEENKEQRENEKEQNLSEEEIVKPRGWIRRWMRSIFLSLVCCKTSEKKTKRSAASAARQTQGPEIRQVYESCEKNDGLGGEPDAVDSRVH
ncbi:uncharacterized protein LOC143808315 [Ranitomeya variabilis]|uniref:uncharacterized protein LOC143808315 n=1 Tax=Ranitomeya variabilis TaxID=490064 RepID=UPI004055BC90